VSATWGARCGKPARRVLRGGTGARRLAPRPVPTRHRVNHDVLMARVARRVKDKRVLLLTRRYLQAGMMEGGLVSPRTEGTPQGGPASPLLSNILLDELDKELERRGHRFVRYADDSNVYVRSKGAGERVMTSLERFLAKRLRLKVNRDKSAVARPWQRKFLGYSVTSHLKPRLKVAPESLQRLKGKLRSVWRRGRGRSLASTIAELNPVLRGWVAYYRMVDTKGSFEALDAWARRKLRAILWRQWKRPGTRLKKLRQRGVDCGSRQSRGHEQSWPLVECWRQSHEPSRTDRGAAAAGTREPARRAPEACELCVNRRVRNRTHGGVGAGDG